MLHSNTKNDVYKVYHDIKFLSKLQNWDEKRNRTCQSALLTCIVSCDVAQSPGGSFLHPGVKLLQAENQGVHPPAGHHCLGQLWGVFGHCTKHKCCCLLIEPLRTETQIYTWLNNNWGLNWNQAFIIERYKLVRLFSYLMITLLCKSCNEIIKIVPVFLS